MNENSGHVKVIVETYKGNALIVDQIRKLVIKKYSDVFYAVIVHGSVATNEVVSYSDFDGLLIVKDEYVDSKILKRFEQQSLRLIFNFDPLQHHKWFKISERDLSNYPEDYFPNAILNHSRLMYPMDDGLELQLKLKSNLNYNLTLIGLLDKLDAQLERGWRPRNSYQLKSFLSEIMLLPSLYYSLKTNRGIFKKESFTAVAHDFSELEWMPVVTASKIRNNWGYPMNRVQKALLSITNWRVRKISARLFAPAIKDEIKAELSDNFYANLSLFIQRIRKDI
ncbi:nucleotidyltransferase domain-containing protein [Winogradskyella sp. KYW1333]|uniref:nucleotidyltransferase domain-containing protein n=1 Tax=Winogradskyella sp. KYW1333 TaxID=2282123 RepID=UPI000DF24ED1|nr:nucleotidyltransferase domain-containing protein [Winogradskyella sp. KYW1333]RCT55352.1 nucleotidyltransferase domain-containing protein [Winogradskyella sp. KYW1333]